MLLALFVATSALGQTVPLETLARIEYDLLVLEEKLSTPAPPPPGTLTPAETKPDRSRQDAGRRKSERAEQTAAVLAKYGITDKAYSVATARLTRHQRAMVNRRVRQLRDEAAAGTTKEQPRMIILDGGVGGP